MAPTHRTESDWRRLIDDWDRSGLSAPEMAERAGSSASSLYKWRAKFEAEALTSPPEADPQMVPVVVSSGLANAAEIHVGPAVLVVGSASPQWVADVLIALSEC